MKQILDPYKDDIIEIAAIKVELTIIKSFVALFLNERKLPDEIVELTETDQILAKKGLIFQRLWIIRCFVGELPIVGYNLLLILIL